jgi:hypothetical protein
MCEALGFSSNTAKKKSAGGMTQVAEHLPSKHKVLNSNPSAAKKKEKKEIDEIAVFPFKALVCEWLA